MVTAKIGGSSNPWTKRQNTSSPIEPLSGIAAVGMTISAMAPAMIRLRPSTSAIMPTKGAPKATAKVVAPMLRLTSAGLASKSRVKSGSSGWVAYKLMKAQRPVRAIAMRRLSASSGGSSSLFCDARGASDTRL